MKNRSQEFFNPNNLCDDYSPSIPFDFPKEKIPGYYLNLRKYM